MKTYHHYFDQEAPQLETKFKDNSTSNIICPQRPNGLRLILSRDKVNPT